MNILNLNEVNKLVNIRTKCRNSLGNLSPVFEKSLGHRDAGGVEGFDFGYDLFVGPNKDGSGGVDLNGCYIANMVYRAVQDNLNAQIAKINIRLEQLGVEV